jgi:hypothetical protein
VYFLLYTAPGSLVMVIVASFVVGLLVWCAVRIAVASVAFALWRLSHAF